MRDVELLERFIEDVNRSVRNEGSGDAHQLLFPAGQLRHVTVDEVRGAGPIQIAAEGAGPQDGFTGYVAFADPGSAPRPRWGDYGAAVSDGKFIWVASEYIGQTCAFAEYVTDQRIPGI